MTCARTMALWLAAVIVLIAVGFMSSGAQAHGGHAHPGPDRVAASPLSAASTSTVAITSTVAKSVATALVARVGMATDLAHACDGACCRMGTSCCTGTALAPDTQAALPRRRPGEPVLARALPARTDVVPDALPDPPRPFA